MYMQYYFKTFFFKNTLAIYNTDHCEKYVHEYVLAPYVLALYCVLFIISCVN